MLRKTPLKKGPRGETAAKKAHAKVKKESVNAWKKKAWTVFSKWIRERDEYKCYTCPARGQQAGHFISRRINAVLYDEMNVHAQCYFCNNYQAGNIGVYADRLMREYGTDAFQELLKRAKGSKQFTVPELKGIIEKYQVIHNPADPRLL